MILGPDGRPAPVDTRTDEQREWDRRFRAQMGHNHGVYFAPEFINEVKKNLDIREQERKRMMAEPERNPRMDLIVEAYDDKVKTPKNRVWIFPSVKDE